MLLTDGWQRGAAEDPGTELLVSLTVFTHDRYRDLPLIGLEALTMRRFWARCEGSLWILQWTDPATRQLGDLTVWTDESHLREFVDSETHQATVRRWRGRLRGDHHTWTVPYFDRHQVWRQARDLISGEGR